MEMEMVEINSLNEPVETAPVDELAIKAMLKRTVKLTLAQAEVAAALYSLTNVSPLPQVEPREIFPQQNNIHNGARRTFNKLVKLGLIETLPAGHYPRYRVTQELFDALIVWKNDMKNYDAFQAFELSCF